MTNYADYKSCEMVDGEGVRNSLYFSGCRFACKGCYNKKIQSFSYGKPFTEDIIQMILEDTDREFIQGLSILGGEPMQNLEATKQMVQAFRTRFQYTKDIWLWTGYNFEELIEMGKKCEEMSDLLREIDVLVDGRFKIKEHKKGLAFRGSANQRIICCQDSIQKEKVILYKGGDY